VTVLRGDAFGVELHPLDQVGAVTQTHDRAVLQPGGHLKLGRQGVAFHHQAVIAGRLEGRGQSAEHSFPGMVHRPHLAMHDLVAADHLAAERLTDGLVAQADAQKRDAGTGGSFRQRQANPGGGGVAGAGGKDDHLGLHRDDILDLKGIVPLDDHVGPKLACRR
jgi:hypothetical protein